jgi:hypothetical protein
MPKSFSKELKDLKDSRDTKDSTALKLSCP